MANCEYCQKPLPQHPPGRTGPKRRFCNDGCRLSAWLGKTPDQIERISGPWPLPCPVCGVVGSTIERVIYNRELTVSRWYCPCGHEDTLTRPYDPEHDLEPFPRPILTLEIPTNDVEYWKNRALRIEAKLNEILAAVQRRRDEAVQR